MRKLPAFALATFLFLNLSLIANGQGSIAQGQNHKLCKIKRINVASFGEDAKSKLLRALVIENLVKSGPFKLTEDELFPDATLKGVGIETGGGVAVLSLSLVASNGRIVWTYTADAHVEHDSQAAIRKVTESAVGQLSDAWHSVQKK